MILKKMIKPREISIDTCKALIGFGVKTGMKELNSPEGSPAFFHYLTIDGSLKDSVERALNVRFHTLRLHLFKAGDYATKHTDNAYPDCYTVILRLDDNNESRLKIEGELIQEKACECRVLPPLTEHEVTKGEHERYTLCGWVE